MTRILAVVMAATVIAGEAAEPIDVYNDIDVSEGGVYPVPVRIHRERLHRWATDPDYDTIADDIGGESPESRERPCIVRLTWGEEGRSLSFTNLVNGATYEYEVEKLDGTRLSGSFTTEDTAPRCLSVPVNYSTSFVLNARDVGGWPLLGGNGKRTRTGVFYRSAALDSFFMRSDLRANNTVIPDELGVKTELDLRGLAEDGDLQRTGDGTPASMESEWYYYEKDLPSGVLKANERIRYAPSVSGDRVRLFQNAMHSSMDYTDSQDNNTNEIARAFHVLGNRDYHPVLFHCSAGRDRTGLIAFLISGLCGVGEIDLYRDNIISSFSALSPLTSERVDSYMKRLYMTKAGGVRLFGKYGESTAGRVRAYLEYIGVPESDMAAVVEAMTGETLEEVLERVNRHETADGTRTVAFVSGSTGEAYSVHRVAAGAAAKAPAENPQSELRDFAGWSEEVYDAEDGIYKRTETWTPKNFVTVLFKDPFGTVLASKTIEGGGDFSAFVPAAPAGTEITGWNSDLSDITADTTVTCTMTGKNGYVGSAGEPVSDPAILSRGGDEVRSFTSADGLTRTYVHVFSDTSGASTFVNDTGSDLAVTYLAVGGGGAGGCSYSGPTPLGGGGGGGGGVVGDTAVIASGASWVISVGAGGTSSSNRNAVAHCAGATTIYCGETEIATAPGGGAGGNSAGLPGASGAAGGGCAASSENTSVAAGTFSSRCDGIDYAKNPGGNYRLAAVYGSVSRPALAGGGGGAGSGSVSNAVESMVSGHGGRGVYSSITGELKMYGGGGGGGGGYSSYYEETLEQLGFGDGVIPGEGSNGGGRGGYVSEDVFHFAQSGADGFGGGGGGQVAWNFATAYPKPNEADAKTVTGMSGGSGVVIVRYDVPVVTQEEESGDGQWTVTIDDHAGTLVCDGWTLSFYGESNGGIIITSGNSLSGDGGLLDLSLPMRDADGNEYYVRGIGQKAFRAAENPSLDPTKILEVRLGERVTSIDAYAFQNCSGLTNVVPFLPDSVNVLGKNAFHGCPIAGRLTLRNVEKIPERAFYATMFGEAELPGITNIDYQAFFGNGILSNVVFGTRQVGFVPANAANGIGNGCFRHAPATARFYFPGVAPSLPKTGTDDSGQGYTGTSWLFGKGGSCGIYGSWRLDPDGWSEILSGVGRALSQTDGTPSERGARVRSVKGKLFFRQETAANSAWLFDWRSPLEPKYGVTVSVR